MTASTGHDAKTETITQALTHNPEGGAMIRAAFEAASIPADIER